MLVLPNLMSGFQHRRMRSPAPLDVWVPRKHEPARLDLATPPAIPALPLTPPLTPASTRRTDSDASSIDIAPRDFARAAPWPAHAEYHVPEPCVLPSPTSPTHPRAFVRDPEPQPASRFLFVSGVPKDATSQGLKQAFLACGDLKGIFVRFQAEHGAIVLAFYDIRHTVRAHRQINTRALFAAAPLQARFISPEELRDLIGHSSFVSANDGQLRIATSPAGLGGELDAPALQNVLASFGELRAFHVVDARAKAYHAEFFDARDATSALGALDGRVILRERLHLAAYTPAHTPEPFPTYTPTPVAPAAPAPAPAPNTVPFPTAPAPASPPRAARRLSVDSSAPAPGPQYAHARRTSNIYHFDSTGKAPAVLHTPPRPRSISVASEGAGLGLVGAAECEVPQRVVEPPPPVQVAAQERNKIDVGRIERGDDTRTTVMIKNIPNKMSDRHLIEFINDVCPRKIDFLYLRMDFTNGCNVGYAFVNFIRVEDLLHFARAKLGTKWNLFSSEKILGMSYANYQGKEALIDKFRSSSIMDQRESWRPKLFYSAGPKKGLPEDFPAPTHLRRKERAAAGAGELHAPRAALFHRH